MLLTLRSIWLGAGALIAGALAVGGLRNPHPTPPAPTRLTGRAAVASPRPGPQPPVADSVVALGLRLRGVDYQAGGTTPQGGFDCSGFVRYCFAQQGVAIPPSSALQSRFGREVPRAQARPGDVIIFAGTAEGSRTPGHTGIVISKPGEPLRFVHSSSARKEHGVKVSQVDSTGYEKRLLSVRRVLEDAAVGGAAPVVPLVPPQPVAPLTAHEVPLVTPAPRMPAAVTARHRATGTRVPTTHRLRRHPTRAATPRPKSRAVPPKPIPKKT